MGTRLPELGELLRAGERGGAIGNWFLGILYKASARSAALFKIISYGRNKNQMQI